MADARPDDVLTALRAALATPEAAALLQAFADAFAEAERLGRARSEAAAKIPNRPGEHHHAP